MSSASDFAGDYAPGGLTKRSRACRAGRRGGLASGIKRRQLARGRRGPRCRTRAQALALSYRHRQLTREAFERRYETLWPRPERPTAAVAWEKGRDTLWCHYAATFRLYRTCGQHTRTTNGQRGAALHSQGRPRSRRTIQRLHRKLEALELATFAHYRDQRDRPGHKDCLVLEIRTPTILHVTPPLRGRGNRPSGSEVPPAAPERQTEDRPKRPLIPPASPADDTAATPQSTERGELEAALRFQQLKLDAGWATAGVTCKIRQLRCELRATRGLADDRPPRRGSNDPYTAP